MFNTGPVAIPTFRGRSSPQFGGNISYYADDLLVGKHKFKAGFTQLRELVYFNYADKASGNNQLIYRSGVPFQIATYNRPVTDDKDHQTDTSAYLKDTWSIKRVTANVGVRFQQYHDYTEPAVKVQGTFGNAGSFTGVDVQLKRAVEPRLGVAFDLRGDAKTVLKAFYGRFHLNPGDDFADAYNPNTLVTTTYRWKDRNGKNDYTPGEVNLDVNGPDFVSISGSNNLINPNLRLPYSDEISGGIEHEVWANLGARVLYVYKREVDLYQSVNALRPYSAWNIPITRIDPGPDGILNTADDSGLVTFYDYDPAYRGSKFVGNMWLNQPDANHYQTLEFTVVKRPTKRWDMTASVLPTKNYRWIVGIPQSPNDEFNRLDQTWSESGKLVASYWLPRGVHVGAVYQYVSGQWAQRTYQFPTVDPAGGRPISQAGTVTLRLDPFGSERLPAQSVLNLRLAKQFELARTMRLKASVDVFNALNSNSALTVGYASGPTYGAISAITPPRIARFSVSFSF